MEEFDLVALLDAIRTMERNVSITLMYSGLRLSQYRLLDRLEGEHAATVTQMSRALNITRASVSVMINELVQCGVLAMVENPSDRRSFYLRLTELGRNKLNVARSDLSVLQAKLAGRYSEETIRILNGFCRSHQTGPRP